jgi:hypothetical protein
VAGVGWHPPWGGLRACGGVVQFYRSDLEAAALVIMRSDTLPHSYHTADVKCGFCLPSSGQVIRCSGKVVH